MPRAARIVLPEVAHHVVQRGNRRQQVFFCESDYRYYLRLLRRNVLRFNVEVLAYCLMPNHVHCVVMPATIDGLMLVFRETHREYTNMINRRENWTGFLWQGRFFSSPADESYALEAARYSEQNPVFAGLVAQPEVWRWSSALGHLGLYRDPLISSRLTDMVSDWRTFLSEAMPEKLRKEIRSAIRANNPLGSLAFLRMLEAKTGRKFISKKQQ